MADSPEVKSTRKRVVKNPESFRERAIKATEEGDKPQKRSIVRANVAHALSPIGRFFKAIANAPIIKPFKRPLRIIGKIIVPVYFRNSWKELKLVSWPSFKESMRLTYAVLIFAIVFGVSIAVVDYGLDIVFKKILLK